LKIHSSRLRVDLRGVARAARGQQHVLLDRQVGEDAHVLGHVGHAQAGDLRRRWAVMSWSLKRRALRGAPQAHDGAQRGRLAGAVAPQQHGELPARHGEVDAVQDVVRPDVRVHAGGSGGCRS
jgi:hypothetical protein